MLELYNSILKSTTDFIENYTDETSLKCALGMIVDQWVAVHGGNSEEIFRDILAVNIMVNNALGTLTKEDVYGSTSHAS